VTELEDLLPGPEGHQRDEQRVQQPSLETEREGQHADRPPPDAIGPMRVDVERLRHQPDARAIEEAAQEENGFRQGSGIPLVAQTEADGVGDGDDTQHDEQLALAGEIVPVVADEEQGGEADQGRRRGHQHEHRPRPPPLGHLSRAFI
jgi:hypothetical protein